MARILSTLLVVVLTSVAVFAHSLGSDNDTIIGMMEDRNDMTHEQAEAMIRMMQGNTQADSAGYGMGMMGMMSMMGMMNNHQGMVGVGTPYGGLWWISSIFATLLLILLTVLTILLIVWVAKKIAR